MTISAVGRNFKRLIRAFTGVSRNLGTFVLALILLPVSVARSQSTAAPEVPPRVVQAHRFLQNRGWPRRSVAHSSAIRSNAPVNALSEPASTAVWQPLGPAAVMTPNYGLVTGRVSSIAIDPADATGNHVFVGTTGGGVWASQNAASSGNVIFRPLTDASSPFDGLRFGSNSIGALTVQPGGTGVVLAGTGDPNDALDSYYGAGILRSTDGGSTWSVIAQSTDQIYSFMGEGFAGFAWSTVNPQLVVAAVAQSYEGTLVNAPYKTASYAGLYYSLDAGATWWLARIMDGNGKDVQGPSASFASPNGNSATSVVWNPVRRLFIAAVRFHGYYQSADGITWTRMIAQPGVNLTTQMCPSNPGAVGSIACPIFRGALAVNPQSGDTFAWTVNVYNQDQGLWQDSCNVTAGECNNLTVTFSQQLSTTSLRTNTLQGAATIANGDYNLALAAVPSGQDTILLAGANDLWRCSLAMGCTWRNTTNANSCMSSHVAPYQHALTWNTANPPQILIGNDSGLWRSMDAIGETGSVCSTEDAAHFQNLNAGLGSLSEVNSISSVVETPYTMIAGLGVNGTAGVKSASGPTTTWPQIIAGEGGAVVIDGKAPANWYVNSGAGVSIHRCSTSADCTPEDFGTQPIVDNADVADDGYSMISPAPFILDPLDSSQVLVGTCRLWRGPADGTRWTQANAVTPFLDGMSGQTYCSGDPLIRSIAARPLSGGGEVVYVGLFGSLDGGAILGGHLLKATITPGSSSPSEWDDLTFNPVVNSFGYFNPYASDVSSIYIDPNDASGKTAYVTVAGIADIYKSISTVYRTTDGGLHWYDISSNIRNSPANSIVVDPQDSNTVYVATDAGVFSTRQVSTCATNTGNCWSVFGTGLPYAPVTELSATPASGSPSVLVAATYGRGIWQVPLLTAGMQTTTASTDLTSLTFVTQAVGTESPGQTVTLTNNGAIALAIASIAAGSPFRESDNCAGKVVNEGASCAIQVTFAPNQAGAVTGELRILANVSGGQIRVALAGTGSQAGPVNVSPGTIDFGQVAIGKTSSLQTVAIENTTGNAIPITSITAPAPFSIATNPCGTSLQPNSACAVSVVFTPTQAGSISRILSVVDGAGTQTIYLKGSGAAAATDTLSASSLTFAPTAVGQESSPQVVTLSNDGDLLLDEISVATSAGFRSSDTCGVSLGAHAVCSISVVFAPTAVGTADGSVTVTDSIRTQTIRLAGTASAAAALKASSTQIAFGAVSLGNTSAPVALTITNSGGAAVSDIGFQMIGPAAKSFSWNSSSCAATLQSNSSCAVQLIFAPTQAGQLVATFVISSSTAGVSPIQVGLSGVGQGASGILISPPQLTFVQPVIGASSAPQFATLTNTSDLTASELRVNLPAPFSATQSTCGSSLGPGASCSIGVIFTPVANGSVQGVLSVTSRTFADPATAALEGFGGAAGSLQVQPVSITFPSTGVGTTSASQQLTLTNSGPVALSGFSISAPVGFEISSSTCATTLGISASCSVQVSFLPKSAGQQTGDLNIKSSSLAAPAQVALSGMGFDFLFGITGTSSKTVSSGQTAAYTLSLTPLNGSAGNFTFACSSLPANAVCSFNPANASVPANATWTVTLNISTGHGGSIADATPSSRSKSYLSVVTCLFAIPFVFRIRKRRWWVVLLAISLIGIASCAGAGGGGGTALSTNQSTAAGTYPIVVTAKSNGISHSATVSLTVD
ncbi:MAG: choice-of-anchor D domain-containing protein [Acidobacteria bacterium]|nr:choice-of-anchor D domain-containing protein [Acidobacteriota bacterium]